MFQPFIKSMRTRNPFQYRFDVDQMISVTKKKHHFSKGPNDSHWVDMKGSVGKIFSMGL